jgi:hypothetical protein
MKRLTLLGAVAALAVSALPGMASAARINGVVVAKDAARHTIAVASSGQVRTVRVSKLGAVAVGRRVDVTGTKLADGTFRGQKVRVGAKAAQVRFGAVIVRNDDANQRLIVSAGGTVFAIRYAGGASFASEGSGLQPGDQVKVSADVDKGGLAAGEGDVKETGHVGQLKIEGIFIKGGNDGFDLAVVHRGLVRVHFKLGSELPDWQPGDVIVLVVTVNDDRSFTLVQGRPDGQSGKTGDENKGTGDSKPTEPTGDSLGATGTLGSRDDGKVNVSTDRGVVTCKVPTTMNISVFATGDKVTIYCKKRDGVFWLVGMKSDKATVTDPGTGTPTPPKPTPVTSAGVLTDGPAGSVTVRLEDGSTVSCKVDKPVPAGLFKAGDAVKMTCTDGTLTGLRSDVGQWNPTTTELGVGGPLTAGSGGTATVQKDAVKVSCSLPAGMDLTTYIALGTKVWMSCKVREGALVFALVQVGDQLTLKADGTGERYAAGTFARGTDSVTVTREDASTLTCAAPASLDLSSFAAGSKVKVKCRLVAGVWTLKLIGDSTHTVEVPS